jgi:hypothetical protein
MNLALEGHEVLAQRLAGEHDLRAVGVEGLCRRRIVGRARAQAEFGIAEVDHVVGRQQARAVDALAVDEGAVGAVQVDQAQAAADVLDQFGVPPAQAAGRHDEFVDRVTAHAERQRLHPVRQA